MSAIAIKSKVAGIVNKVSDSKLYKAVEKGAVTASAFLMTTGAAAMTTFAAEVDNTLQNSLSVDESAVLNYTQPFMSPAIKILCVVGGIKLGMSFLKRAFH